MRSDVVGVVIEKKKKRVGPGDNMILSPGWAGIAQNRAFTTDFTKAKARYRTVSV